jgi:hypothetical protein
MSFYIRRGVALAKTILSVGFRIPGGGCECVNVLTNRSLLDADIIIFQPGITRYGYSGGTYHGKPCLSDNESFRVRDSIAHWRRELAQALDAGKLIFVLLDTPEVVYAATGEKEYSGTGRNARSIRLVEEVSVYEALPIEWRCHAAIGTEMMLMGEARFFAPYWSEFGQYSQYRLYFDGKFKEPLVTTKTGSRTVGICVRKGPGTLIAVPALDFKGQPFKEDREVNGEVRSCWTKEAKAFGRRFTSALIAMSEAITSASALTPNPAWTLDDSYRLAEESSIEFEIGKITEQILNLDAQERDLKARLETAGNLRRLLFEQGKPLEGAVLQSLRLLGFMATGFREGGSEFDAIFTSEEGRFLGEVEGKDNKAINIGKFSQLERNLNEDFAREDVTVYAKGVLFGNAYRLRCPTKRASPFTEKCQMAAVRLGVALVHTPDLFEPTRYLKEHEDNAYAKACREAIFATNGTIVQFPVPPSIANNSDVLENEEINVDKTKPAK